MSEAVRTMASPAAIWAIVVIATILALFMATVAMFQDLRVARIQREERERGIGPELGDPWAMAAGSEWPRLSEALLAAAGIRQSAAAEVRSGAPAMDAAGRHAIPAQRAAPAEHPVPAQYAGATEEEPPTVPIPAAGERDMQGRQYASGRDERHAGGPAGDAPTMPDLPAQQAPGHDAVQMPRQRTGESDRAERSFAGPAPQDDDEDEQ